MKKAERAQTHWDENVLSAVFSHHINGKILRMVMWVGCSTALVQTELLDGAVEGLTFGELRRGSSERLWARKTIKVSGFVLGGAAHRHLHRRQDAALSSRKDLN